ncbi:transglycosylase SLT domain-containing protein [Imbroritus primus]
MNRVFLVLLMRAAARRQAGLVGAACLPPRLTTWAASAALAVLAVLAYPGQAQAGAQQEEFLANAVRGALSAAIADDRPRRVSFAAPADHASYQKWLAAMSKRLENRIPEAHARLELLETVYYESKRAGLEPSLVLGLIQVESNFRKYAISSAGARGLMQVMPFWTRSIGDGDERKLFHLQSNLRYGCTILRHYIDRENGDLFLALGRYNGSRGRAEYPNLVHAAWQRWHYADSLPLLASAGAATGAERAQAMPIPSALPNPGGSGSIKPAGTTTLANPFSAARVSDRP